MKPLYALHKDRSGNILNASSFKYETEIRNWVGALDIRGGDTIAFGEVLERSDDPEPVRPAFLSEEPLRKAETPVLADAEDDKPF